MVEEARKGLGYSFKIVVLGEPGVGKTSILRIWSNEDVPDPPPAPAPTATFEFGHRLFKSAELQRCYQIEESIEVHFLERGRDIEKVEKWQLEEEIKEKGVPPELFPVDQMDTLSAFYNGIAIAFIVFSIPDQKNLDDLKKWIAEITKYNKNPDLWITIIGNKRDLSPNKLCMAAECGLIPALLKLYNLFGCFAASALTTHNVENILESMIVGIIEIPSPEEHREQWPEISKAWKNWPVPEDQSGMNGSDSKEANDGKKQRDAR